MRASTAAIVGREDEASRGRRTDGASFVLTYVLGVRCTFKD